MDKEKLHSSLAATASINPQWVENSNPAALLIDKIDLTVVCQQLWSNPNFFFDQLSCITGIDNGPEVNTMEVIYTLSSIPFNHSINLKVVLGRQNPEVESVTSIWKSANWLEREIFDLYGIKFLSHPDLRRILTPADWDGFPLRKDYTEPESYRGIETKAIDNGK